MQPTIASSRRHSNSLSFQSPDTRAQTKHDRIFHQDLLDRPAYDKSPTIMAQSYEEQQAEMLRLEQELAAARKEVADSNARITELFDPEKGGQALIDNLIRHDDEMRKTAIAYADKLEAEGRIEDAVQLRRKKDALDMEQQERMSRITMEYTSLLRKAERQGFIKPQLADQFLKIWEKKARGFGRA